MAFKNGGKPIIKGNKKLGGNRRSGRRVYIPFGYSYTLINFLQITNEKKKPWNIMDTI